MLPDFPTVRSEVKDFLRRFLIKRTSEHTGALQNVKKVPLHECTGFKQHRFDGSIDEKPLRRLGTRITLDMRDIDQRGFDAVLDAYDLAAKEMAEKQSRLFFRRFEEIVTEAGQSFDAGGRSFTPELFLEYFEKVDIDFDQDGQPVFPTLLCGRAVRKAVQEWEFSDEHQKHLEKLIEQKRLAWRDAESDRRLVD